MPFFASTFHCGRIATNSGFEAVSAAEEEVRGGQVAYFDPQDSFERLKSITSKTVKDYFPVVGKKQTLHAHDIWVEDNLHIDDIDDQKDAKEKGRTWAVPVKAKLDLIDNATGKVVDQKTITVANLPKMTRRHSYIVDGSEWQVANQFRLKSGVFARVKANGELESLWNLKKGFGFDTLFDPKSRKMVLHYGSAHIPMYPVLRTLGVQDNEIEKAWGKEIFHANKKEGGEEKALRQLYRTMTGGKAVDDLSAARDHIVTTFAQTELRPDSTELTLGRPFNKVSGESLLAGTHKLLKVSRGEVPPDDRDSLVFKDLYSTEDLVAERLNKDAATQIKKRLLNRIDKGKSLRDIVTSDTFGHPIKSFFAHSPISERPTQMNPINFLGGARQTTIGGQHGITDDTKIQLSAQSINASHIGFLDPIQTPEARRIGTILQMSLASEKKGKDIYTRVIDPKTGKKELINAQTALKSTVAFPDQYKWEKGKPIPRHDDIRVTDKNGDISIAKPHEVQYIFESARGMFDIASNLIPFLQSNQGNRAMVAAKQQEQAVSLVQREHPLVQTGTDAGGTFEGVVGRYSSHKTPVSGEVTRVTRTAVHIKASDGSTHKVQLYNDFPLNDPKSVLNSEPLVKAGDKVKASDIVADTNFTRNGSLALGTNLRVAYMPYKGYNFEDGIVISESAAKKLTSEHMLRHSIAVDPDGRIILNKRRFIAETAGQIKKEQEEKLDEHGVAKEGMTVSKGDVLIGALKKQQQSPDQQQLALFSKKLLKPVVDASVRWDKDYPGVVTKVVRHGKETTVYVKAQTPAEIGDKIVGRHGNKGIITSIIPDHEMPRDKHDSHVEVILNPTGVPTRINLGQVLETAASKIAEKTGKPYIVNNFDPNNTDYTRNLLKHLEEHGLSDTEKLYDAKTGREFGDVLTGKQYILKLHHTAEKGITARSFGSNVPYDVNSQPKKSHKASAQSMDVSGLYALLAHGARENVREMQTIKADQNDEYWAMLQAGEAPPPPRVPFVYRKFESYLRSMGVDTKKHGNLIQLQPLTDKQTLAMSNGELKRPDLAVRGKDVRPETGSLFDPDLTGTKWPHGNFGEKWTHITLATKMPNPLFETPIRALLGLTKPEFLNVIEGKSELGGKTGPEAVVHALTNLDTEKKLGELKAQLPRLRGNRLNNATRQVRFLSALQKVDMKPHDAYTVQHLPVIPPNMRPISIMDDGSLSTDDLNDLYRGIGMSNDKLKNFDYSIYPEEEAHPLKASLYDGLKALMFTGATFHGRHKKGIGEIVGGGETKKAKEAFFQGKMIGKRQDLSMRGVIVPEPSLGLDEVAIPKKAAAEIYKPFVVRRLVQSGVKMSDALRKVRENHPDADEALKAEVEARPLLLKRDPVLHKYGVQAFKPKLTTGQAVKIHPLATSGFNADFDGDKMGAFVPVSHEAVKEAFNMLPSKNLFSPSHGRLMYEPTQEAMFGLYKLSRPGKHTDHKFNTPADAVEAYRTGKIDIDDVVHISDPHVPLSAAQVSTKLLQKTSAEPVKTTVGRLALYHLMPEGYKDPALIHDPNFLMDKPRLRGVLESVGKKSPQHFAHVADKLKDLGNDAATGVSFSIKDLVSDHEHRDHMVTKAREEEKKIRASEPDKAKRDDKITKLYEGATKEIHEHAKKRADSSRNRMYDWIRSGARGGWDQYSQMTVAPMLVVDSSGKTIPVPITKSYSEGLDVGSYWAALHGARMGAIGRTISTSEPGALTKEMMQTSMNQLVTSDDCGTTKGITLSVEDKSVLDRFTASPIHLGNRGGKDKGSIDAGTLVTPELVSRLKNNKIQNVPVRTPLKCAEGQGLCAKCYGLNHSGHVHERGTNLGVMAAHSLGEPLTQMSMNAFHTGGVAGAAGSKSIDHFTRVQQVVRMPEVLPGSAVLSTVDGHVDKVEHDKATGGWNVHVAGENHYVPALKGHPTVKAGQEIKKGESLSEGPKNPRDLLAITKNVGSVQQYLVEELEKLYGGKSNIHRRNTEVFIRALTNIAEVRDPGDHPNLMKGDHVHLTEILHFNSKLPSGGKPIEHDPILKGTNVLPTDVQTDWLAMLQSKDLKRTIADAAAEGWHSDIHNVHPVPGMAFGAEFGKGTKEKTWLY
jgi:DNA-directed RNA polymerase subunit beta'